MTYNIGDKITIRVLPSTQSDFGVDEIVEVEVVDTDLGDTIQPYRLKLPGRSYGLWLRAQEYTIIETPTVNTDLDIAQVLVDYAANRLTLQEAVTSLKGLHA